MLLLSTIEHKGFQASIYTQIHARTYTHAHTNANMHLQHTDTHQSKQVRNSIIFIHSTESMAAETQLLRIDPQVYCGWHLDGPLNNWSEGHRLGLQSHMIRPPCLLACVPVTPTPQPLMTKMVLIDGDGSGKYCESQGPPPLFFCMSWLCNKKQKHLREHRNFRISGWLDEQGRFWT